MPTAEAASPLSDDEIEALFAPLAEAVGAALAVSGGADSVALMLAARRWVAGRSGFRFIVLTVDHGLRPSSGEEAKRVASWAEGLGFAADILVWSGAKPSRDLQAAARTARYRLLADRARALGLGHVLTAHHQDDQAETVLLRLARGSGLQGLCGMRRRRPLDGLCLLRPFLSVPRARLLATCRAAGHPWIEDPSNADPRFARARLWALAGVLAREGLTPARLAATAGRLQRAQDAVDWIVGRTLADAAEIHDAGFVRLPLAAIRDVPEEAALRALARVLQAVGGRNHPPRLERLEALWRGLGQAPRLRRTLAGCLVSAEQGVATVMREAGREPLPVLTLAPGTQAVWDGRFRVRLSPAVGGPLAVRALGAAGAALEVAAGIPGPARRTLVSLWRGDDLVAVPPLGVLAEDLPAGAVEARFLGLTLAPPRQELASACRVRNT